MRGLDARRRRDSDRTRSRSTRALPTYSVSPGGVQEEIDARLLGQPRDLALEIVNRHGLRSGRRFGCPLPDSAHLVTFTGAIGKTFNFPLRLIIAACVRLRIHPNILTFTGVLINIGAGWALADGQFLTAGVDHDRRQHLRLHRRQGRDGDRRDQQVRRLLGLGDRSLLRPGALGRPHLPLLVARPHRLRAHHLDRDGLRDDDELHARARRIADPRSARSASWSGPSASCSS